MQHPDDHRARDRHGEPIVLWHANCFNVTVRCLAAIILVVLIPTRSSADEAAALWNLIREKLVGPDSADFWEHNLQYAVVPGGAGNARALRGTVMSSHPTLLVLAISDDRTPEVTLKVSTPLRATFPRGTVVLFQGVATDFSKDPFMLTFEVEQDGHTFVEKSR